MSKYLPNTAIQKTSTATAITGSCLLFGVQCATGGTATIYDNTSAAGNIVAIGTPGDTIIFNNPVVCNNGIHVSMTGTSVIVYVTVS